MKKVVLAFLSTGLLGTANAQNCNQTFVTEDITRFWQVYEQLQSAPDSAAKARILQEQYLDKASEGLQQISSVRGYRLPHFYQFYTAYPQFWQSMRKNISVAAIQQQFPLIEADVQKLKKLYPALQPVPIYFSVGAFRTGGTALPKLIFIGAELSMADKHTAIEELPEWRKPYYQTYHPIPDLPLLCTHEYIHTQQKPMVHNLLSKCLYEGVAEFVSCLATGKHSTTPAVAFGKTHTQQVVDQFVQDLFTMNDDNWLWGQNTNALHLPDLGYYIGYEICERYYNLAKDKKAAIQELVELDYTNEAQVEHIVDTTRLLPKTLAALYADYEKQRPTVVAVTPFTNGSKQVKAGLVHVTVHFSEPLNGYNTGVDFGPGGEKVFPKMSNRSWGADGKSWSFDLQLEAGKHYEILISNNFRKASQVRLKPYLLSFDTE